ncbi:hypothetical protein L7F22_056212 [Adiantum nelumboides]|nr:hypothetical protein [Adiantum nelumboides]
MPEDFHFLDSPNMRALVITEHFASASLIRSTASPKTLLIKSSSHNKTSAWGYSPWHGCLLKQARRCILLLFALFLCGSFVFALCTVEENGTLAVKRSRQERRLLGYYGNTPTKEAELSSFTTSPSQEYEKDMFPNAATPYSSAEAALHGLGTVYMKGTKPMQNLIIANLEESCNMLDFRLFLRTLYRSGAMARADLILLFPWSSLPPGVSDVLKEEDDSFKKLHRMNFDGPAPSGRGNSFGDVEESQERKRDIDMSSRGPVFWGANTALQESQEQTNLSDPHYGSVVGFFMNELDSTDAFLEFLSNPSSQLRRWLCYQMLLGLLRFKFRSVMLVELGGVVVLGDVFANAKWKDFLHLTLDDSFWADATAEANFVPVRQSSTLGDFQAAVKSVMGASNMLNETKPTAITRRKKTQEHKRHSREREKVRNLLAGGHADDDVQLRDKPAKQGVMKMVYGREVWNSLEQVEKKRRLINSRVIFSSMRSAKGLASSMVVEIVRVAVQRKNKLSFPDSALLSYLVQKSPHLLGRRITENLQVMEISDSIIRSVESVNLEDVLARSQDGQKCIVLHARSWNTTQRSGSFQNQQNETLPVNGTWSELILANICASTTNSSAFYRDCGR